MDYTKMGAEAFAAGANRFAPLDVLLGNKTVAQGIEDANAWFRGWDRANLDAPVPGWTEAENAAWAKRKVMGIAA